jgi:hypothetical protein
VAVRLPPAHRPRADRPRPAPRPAAPARWRRRPPGTDRRRPLPARHLAHGPPRPRHLQDGVPGLVPGPLRPHPRQGARRRRVDGRGLRGRPHLPHGPALLRREVGHRVGGPGAVRLEHDDPHDAHRGRHLPAERPRGRPAVPPVRQAAHRAGRAGAPDAGGGAGRDERRHGRRRPGRTPARRLRRHRRPRQADEHTDLVRPTGPPAMETSQRTHRNIDVPAQRQGVSWTYEVGPPGPVDHGNAGRKRWDTSCSHCC